MKFLFLVVLFFAPGLTALAKDKIAFKESISVAVVVSGDISGQYDFAGPLGADIEASAAKPETVCTMSALFRKAIYRSHSAIETWLTLICTFDGQKYLYKPNRFYVNPELEEQKIQLPMLDQKLKSVILKFQNLSLTKSK